MNLRRKKLLTIYKTLHSGYDVDRLYVTKKEGARGFIQHWIGRRCIDTTTRRLHEKEQGKTDYSDVKQHKEGQIDQQNKKMKTKIGRKTNLWTSDERNLRREDFDIAQEKKP